MNDPTTDRETVPARARRTARAAAAPVFLQALAVLGFVAWEVRSAQATAPSNAAVFEGSVVYFLLLAVIMVGIGVALWSVRSWAYGPGVFSQLLALAIVYEMVRADFWAGALPLGLSAIAALAVLFSANGRAAFAR